MVRRVLGDAFGHFNDDDGWAMASHLAITALMALFPFLIFATALASFLGAGSYSETAVELVFDTWPEQIAEPIAEEVVTVLGDRRGDFLTFSVVVAAFFASNGVEALRNSLNRAYRAIDTRSIVFRRLQSLAFVLVATVAMLTISLLIVLAPLLARLAEQHAPWLIPHMGTITVWRFVVAACVVTAALTVVHLWLPIGRRSLKDIAPGIGFTLVGWLAGSIMFAAYLDRFADYVNTYAGLASIMVAIVYLYIVSAIFIFGGELNAALMGYRGARRRIRR